MNRSRLLSALFAALVALPLAAADQPQQESQKFGESIEVKVINLDVVVTDKKGNVITGLKPEDFEIIENGVQKPVSNFYEVEGPKVVTPKTAPAAATPAPDVAAPAPTTAPEPIPDNLRRRIIFYIDNLSLAPFNRNKVFKEIKKFVDDSMRPGDEAMIATFNRSMKVRVPFTRDPEQIKQTLDIIAGESSMGVAGTSERRDVQSRIRDSQSYDDALATARSYASSVEHDLRQSAESLNGLMSTLAGVEGKKILVLTSEGFPLQPGKEAFYFLDDISKEKGWGNMGSSMLEGISFDASSLIGSIAKTANANGITMYTVHAGGLAAANDMSAENDRPVSYTVTQAAISNSTESMQMMAEMTGGLASIQTNNFAEAFRKIGRDLNSYYSLGYRAGTERIDRQRSIEVRMKNKQYTARARQTFVEKSPYTEMSDRVVANLLYGTKQNDLHIITRAGQPKPSDDLFLVPLEIQIPIDSLTLIPQGETFAGGFEVYVAVANSQGDMSDVSRKTQEVRIPKDDMPKVKGKFWSYTLDLMMEPGLGKISVGVVDNVGQNMGFSLTQVNAKDLR